MERPIALPPRFHLIRPLGRGARGEVLLVFDEVRGAEVALKIFDRDSGNPRQLDDVRKRFPSLKALSHPALVALHEWLEPAGFTMALADGAPLVGALRGDEDAAPARLVLGQRIESPRFVAPTKELVARTRRVFGAIAGALECLHRASFVHGDVRPENVLVFGERATLIDVDGARPEGTLGDGLVATAWAAPELDDDAARFTAACDVYALGTLLFQVLTGDVPFSGSAHDVVLRKGSVAAPSASFLVAGIPDDLDRLCAAMLERSPARRVAIDAVVRALDGEN